MARADLLLALVRAGQRGDQFAFQQAVEALAAEERAKHHHVLADRLEENLRNGQGRLDSSLSVTAGTVSDMFFEIHPRRTLDDLVLPGVVRTACAELIEEQHRAELLRSHGLEPRHRVLLAGPPGNGKTSLAEALAEALLVPLVRVRYEGVIASFLGETASRLRRLLDFVRSRRCVLFFDEFDAVAKERGDIHETGEIKRVVSSLLLQLDDLPSYVVIVTASNHPELLDRAVWRRFELRLELPPPSREQAALWLDRFEKNLGQPLGMSSSKLVSALAGLSFAELESFGLDVQRQMILHGDVLPTAKIVRERLDQLRSRFAQTEM